MFCSKSLLSLAIPKAPEDRIVDVSRMKQKLKEKVFHFLRRLILRKKPVRRWLHLRLRVRGRCAGHILEKLLRADDYFLS